LPSVPHPQVLAIDRDQNENGRVTYSIKQGRGKAKFRIHPDTGVVYAAKVFERDAEYDLVVRAEDNGTPKRSQTARVSVVVVNVPDESTFAPQIKIPNQHVEVTESDSPGFLVALIQATDEDDNQLWYDIIGELEFLSFLPFHDFIISKFNVNKKLTK
jgi:protocadherin Fat 1/2/3